MNLPAIQDINRATKEVASKSAMNPVQWICALTTPFSLIASAMTDPPIQWFFVFVALLPVLYAIRVYEFFMRRDPDRLHSERYLIEKQIVKKMGKRIGDQEIVIDLLPEAPSENPRLNAREEQS